MKYLILKIREEIKSQYKSFAEFLRKNPEVKINQGNLSKVLNENSNPTLKTIDEFCRILKIEIICKTNK